MDWYESVNFYQIRLINGKTMVWKTNLSYEEAKEENTENKEDDAE